MGRKQSPPKLSDVSVWSKKETKDFSAPETPSALRDGYQSISKSVRNQAARVISWAERHPQLAALLLMLGAGAAMGEYESVSRAAEGGNANSIPTPVVPDVDTHKDLLTSIDAAPFTPDSGRLQQLLDELYRRKFENHSNCLADLEHDSSNSFWENVTAELRLRSGACNISPEEVRAGINRDVGGSWEDYCLRVQAAAAEGPRQYAAAIDDISRQIAIIDFGENLGKEDTDRENHRYLLYIAAAIAGAVLLISRAKDFVMRKTSKN